MKIVISSKVQAKLSAKNPPVQLREIHECFTNRTSTYLLDTRENHQSDPPTRWFIAETHYGRKLKIVFILREGSLTIRSAYPPSEVELSVYARHSTMLDE
jgi:hypothetical protein